MEGLHLSPCLSGREGDGGGRDSIPFRSLASGKGKGRETEGRGRIVFQMEVVCRLDGVCSACFVRQEMGREGRSWMEGRVKAGAV